MSAEENQQKVLAYIANQSNIPTDYEWEIRHHKEMHEAYEKSLYINIKETEIQTLYTSPEVKVFEIKARQMLCGSPGETEKYGSDMGGGEDLNF